MADIFDTLDNNKSQGDIFDKVSPTYETRKTQSVLSQITDKIASYATPTGVVNDLSEGFNTVSSRVPGFIRASTQGKNPIQGFQNPSSIPSTGEYLYLNEGLKPKKDLGRFEQPTPEWLEAGTSAFVGEAADMAMNPLTYIGGAFAKSKIASELGEATSKLVEPTTKAIQSGVKKVKLTFGTPMRNFRKFLSKQEYSADDLKNLPLKDQIAAQTQKARSSTTLKNQELSKQGETLATDIQRTKESKGAFQDFGQAVKEDISTKKNILRKQKQSDFSLQRINDRNARKVITDNISTLDDELTKVSQQGAEDIQPLLKKFAKSNSFAYEERLNKYSDILADSGNPLTREKAFQILDDTTSNLDEMQIVTGRGRGLVEKLKTKYNPYNEDGEIVKSLDDVIDFKEFNKEIRDVFKSISGTAKSGVRITEDDLAQVVLHDKYGSYIAENVPAFQELQQAYKPVINGMKEAGKVFKPYASEFQNTSGANFLKKAALGEQTPQEAKTLGFIEQGSEFSPGVGNVSGKAKEVGGKLSAEKSLLEKTKLTQREKLDSMTNDFSNKFNALDSSEQEVNKLIIERSYDLQNKINELEKGKSSINNLLELNKTRGELRQLQLAERKLRIEKLSHIKRNANMIKLAITGGVLWKTGLPQKAIQSVITGGNTQGQ